MNFMNKYTNYKVKLLTWLLILNSLFACVSTRRRIDTDMETKNDNSLSRSCPNDKDLPGSVDSIPLIQNPILLDDVIIKDLYAHSFSKTRISYWFAKGLNINAKSPKNGLNLLFHLLIDIPYQNNIKDSKERYKSIVEIYKCILECIPKDSLSEIVNEPAKGGITLLMLAADQGNEHLVKIDPLRNNVFITSDSYKTNF